MDIELSVRVKNLTNDIEKIEDIPQNYKILSNLYYQRGNLNFEMTSKNGVNHKIKVYYLEKALDDHFKAAKYNEILGKKRRGSSYYRIAQLYEALNNKEEAIKFYKQSSSFDLRQKDDIFYKLGRLNFAIKEYDDSIRYNKILLSIYKQRRRFNLIPNCYYNIGKAYREIEGKSIEALDFLNKALEISIDKKWWNSAAKSYYHIGQTYMGIKDYEEALKAFKLQYQMNENDHNLEMAGVSNFLISKCLFYLQDENAPKYYEKYLDLIQRTMKKYEELGNWIAIRKNIHDIKMSYDQLKPHKNLIQDSITNFYLNTIEDLKPYDRLNEMAGIYRRLGEIFPDYGQISNALESYEKSSKYYEAIPKKDQVGINYRRMGKIHAKNDFNKALKSYRNAIEYLIMEDNWEEVEITRRELADLYANFGKFDLALETYEESIRYFKEKGDREQISEIYKRIGEKYLIREHFYEAIKYYQKSQDYFIEINNLNNIAFCHRKIGEIYSKMGDINKAIEHYNEIVYDQYSINLTWQNGFKYIRIGDVYKDQGMYDDALRFYLKVFEWDYKEKSYDAPAVANRRIGTIFQILDVYDKSIKHFKDALDFYKSKNNEVGIIKLRSHLAYTYFNNLKWEEALDEYEHIIERLLRNRPSDAIKFQIRSLVCQARISENRGQIKEVTKKYKQIEKLNLKIKEGDYSAYHYLLFKFYKAELLSQKGYHNKCIKLLNSVLNSFKFLLVHIKQKEIHEFLPNLIDFRKTQINLNIAREKAFIAESNEEFFNSMNYYKECADIAKDIIDPIYEQDHLLFNGISDYYLAHYERIKAQKFFIEANSQPDVIIQVYTEEILPGFRKAKKTFHKLNQHLRVRNVRYEIRLLKGKIHELEGNQVFARKYYDKAENLLKVIDPAKAEQFSYSYTSLQPERLGFPIEKFFLNRPLLGDSWIATGNKPNKAIKEEFSSLTILREPNYGYINESIECDVKLKINHQFYSHFNNYSAILVCTENSQEYKVDRNRKESTKVFKFTLPGYSEEGTKIIQFNLKDDSGNIRSETYTIKIKEKPSVYNLLENFVNDTPTLLNLGNLEKIKITVEEIKDHEDIFTVKRIMEFLKSLVSTFQEIINGNYSKSRSNYTILKRFDTTNLPSKMIEFINNVKGNYLTYFTDILNQYERDTNKDHNLERFHPLEFEIHNYIIRSSSRDNIYKRVVSETIILLSKIIYYELYNNYGIFSQHFKWEACDDQFISEYKQLFAKNTGVAEEKIKLEEKLGFEDAKTLLIMKNEEFKNFFFKYSGEINKIREMRNDIQHGRGSINSEKAELCLKMVKILDRENPAFYHANIQIIKTHHSLFTEFLDFIREIFIIPNINHNLQNNGIEEKLDSMQEDISKKLDEEFNIIKRKFDDRFKIIDATVEVRQYNNISESPELLEEIFRINKKINFLIDANVDRVLPKLNDVRLANEMDQKAMNEAISSWFSTIWRSIKRGTKMEKPIVFEFQCENPECEATYRFIYFEKTKLAKIGRIILKIFPFVSSTVISAITKFDKDFEFYVVKFKQEIEEYKLNKQARKATPAEATFLYQTLFGIENKHARTLIEVFQWIEDQGKICFHCKSCSSILYGN